MAEFKLKQTAEEVQRAIDDASAILETTYGDTLTLEQINPESLDPSTLAGGEFLKVCDTVVTMDDLSSGYTVEIESTVADIPPESVGESTMQIVDGVFVFGNAFVSVEERAVGVDIDGLSFSESGLYVFPDVLFEVGASLTITGFTGFDSKKIEEKYLRGATFFYIVDLDRYLYRTPVADEANRVPMAELKKALYGAGKAIFRTPFLDGDWMNVSINQYIVKTDRLRVHNSGSSDLVEYYTAEYVPETTT